MTYKVVDASYSQFAQGHSCVNYLQRVIRSLVGDTLFEKAAKLCLGPQTRPYQGILQQEM